MKALITSILLVVPLAFAGTTFPDYPTRQAKECLVMIEKGGIRVGLDPVETPKAQDSLFGANLAKKGFFPVFLVIENGSSSESLILDTSRVSYGSAASELPAVKTGSITGKALALSTIPFAGGFIAAQETEDFLRIQHNLLEKELRSTTISPGLSAHGFLYIPIQQKASREKMTLKIPIGKSGTNDVVDLDLTF